MKLAKTLILLSISLASAHLMASSAPARRADQSFYVLWQGVGQKISDFSQEQQVIGQLEQTLDHADNLPARVQAECEISSSKFSITASELSHCSGFLLSDGSLFKKRLIDFLLYYIDHPEAFSTHFGDLKIDRSFMDQVNAIDFLRFDYGLLLGEQGQRTGAINLELDGRPTVIINTAATRYMRQITEFHLVDSMTQSEFSIEPVLWLHEVLQLLGWNDRFFQTSTLIAMTNTVPSFRKFHQILEAAAEAMPPIRKQASTTEAFESLALGGFGIGDGGDLAELVVKMKLIFELFLLFDPVSLDVPEVAVLQLVNRILLAEVRFAQNTGVIGRHDCQTKGIGQNCSEISSVIDQAPIIAINWSNTQTHEKQDFRSWFNFKRRSSTTAQILLALVIESLASANQPTPECTIPETPNVSLDLLQNEVRTTYLRAKSLITTPLPRSPDDLAIPSIHWSTFKEIPAVPFEDPRHREAYLEGGATGFAKLISSQQGSIQQCAGSQTDFLIPDDWRNYERTAVTPFTSQILLKILMNIHPESR